MADHSNDDSSDLEVLDHGAFVTSEERNLEAEIEEALKIAETYQLEAVDLQAKLEALHVNYADRTATLHQTKAKLGEIQQETKAKLDEMQQAHDAELAARGAAFSDLTSRHDSWREAERVATARIVELEAQATTLEDTLASTTEEAARLEGRSMTLALERDADRGRANAAEERAARAEEATQIVIKAAEEGQKGLLVYQSIPRTRGVSRSHVLARSLIEAIAKLEAAGVTDITNVCLAVETLIV